MLLGKFMRARISTGFFENGSASSIIYSKWYSPIKYTTGTRINTIVHRIISLAPAEPFVIIFIAIEVKTGSDKYWNIKINILMNLCRSDD